MPITKTTIAILTAITLALLALGIYFRTPIMSAALSVYTKLKVGYQPKPTAPVTTDK